MNRARVLHSYTSITVPLLPLSLSIATACRCCSYCVVLLPFDSQVQQAQGPLSATAVQEFEATSEPSVWEMEQRAHRRGHRSLSEGFHRPANSNAFSDTAGDSLWSRGASSFTPSSSDNRNETANGGGGGGGSFGAASSPSPRASMESKAVSTADEGQGAVQQSPAGAREEAEAAGLQGKVKCGGFSATTLPRL